MHTVGLPSLRHSTGNGFPLEYPEEENKKFHVGVTSFYVTRTLSFEDDKNILQVEVVSIESAEPINGVRVELFNMPSK